MLQRNKNFFPNTNVWGIFFCRPKANLAHPRLIWPNLGIFFRRFRDTKLRSIIKDKTIKNSVWAY